MAKLSIFSLFDVVNKLTQSDACPSLPQALIIGAYLKPKWYEEIISDSDFAYFESSQIPGLGYLFIKARPAATIALFSPVRGTRSATVANAIKSIYLFKISLPERASIILPATPAPHNSLNG